MNHQSNQLSPLQKAALAVKEMRAKLDKLERSQTEPIAIIGMSCRFPGGMNNPTAFWEGLCQGIDAISDIPETRWKVDAYYDSNPDTPGKSYSKRGGFLDQVDAFDGDFFGLSPREINPMDPQQRILLEVSWEALENAAIAPHTLMGSQSGVFLGISVNEYSQATVGGNPEDIDVYTATGNALSVAAGRISHYYGFEGPSLVIETACSSSLVATHLACQSLRKQECDLALTGGIFVMLSPNTLVSMAKLKALSPDGYCKTFDATADGFGRGEGCGLVVLKRLSDAIADGDNILGVIRGTAMNQDGRSSGLTVPNGQAQQVCIRAALKDGKVDPSQVNYIETHGTGTSLGDPIEVKALTDVFCCDNDRDTPLTLGSVKTNIGHLEAAAGIASLIKVVLGIQNKQIPPHLHLKRLNPLLEELPIKIPTQLMPWSVKPGQTRMAGVSSFGFSGTNAHVVVEEWNGEEAGGSGSTSSPTRQKAGGSFLLPLSAKNNQALKDLVNRYQAFLINDFAVNLKDICYTAAVGRSHFNHRLAVVGETKEELLQKLVNYADLDKSKACKNTPKIAFLFTGQGSQSINMGYDLYQGYSVFRKALEKCDELLQPYLETSLLKILYEETNNQLLEQTIYTQPALFSLEYALVQLWQSWGIEPDIMMGHSVGEYVAACVAGIFSLEDALKFISYRGRLMNELPKNGSMVAIFASEKKVKEIILNLNSDVSIAAINGPKNVVVSGSIEAVNEVVSKLEVDGIELKSLQVSHGFHSQLMEPMIENFSTIAEEITYHQPQIDIISNLGEPSKNMANGDYWCRHVREGIQFFKGMKELQAQDYNLFLEIGPSPTLIKMGQRCFDDNFSNIFLSSLDPKQADNVVILNSLKTLYCQGFEIDWHNFYHSQQYQKVALPTYPFQRKKYWHKEVRRQADRENNKTLNYPLLDRRIDSPLKAIQFESIINLDRLPLVKDHCINGTPLMNLVVYLEILFEGAKEVWNKPIGEVKDLKILESLTFPDENSYNLQLILMPDDEDKIEFKLFSQNPISNPQSTWTLHATGNLSLGEIEPEKNNKKNIDFSCISETSYDKIPREKFYKNLDKKGIILGQSCQQIEQIWRKDSEAIVSINPSLSYPYLLPLGEIDAWIQLLLAIFEQNSDQYLLIGLESFRFYSSIPITSYTANTPHTPLYWGQGKIINNCDQGKTVFGNLWLLDQAGNLVAEIINAELKQVKHEKIQAQKQNKNHETKQPLKITRQQLLEANSTDCQTLIETYIRNTLAQSLQVSPTEIDPQQSLLNLIDSLMAMELRSHLERDLGLSVSLEQLLSDRNIQQLANSLQEQITITQMRASTSTIDDDFEEMSL